ncbi:MAG: sigma-70 family RNA polymerase sigma factor [Planctomycetota bacterium]|nr:MAG: sigma-70 family RNA polymerase sigma factor [Planctomycetota bacterium]
MAAGAAGDPEVFAVLYRRHFEAVAGYVFRRTGDAALAEDLAADTFLAAWKALPEFRDSGVPFRSWLLRIATNRANAVARHERVRRRAFGLLARRAAARDAAGGAVADAGTEDLYEALARIRAEYQAVISLVHLEGLRVDQAAEVLGLAAGTVKSRLHRARRALRQELSRTGERS